MARFGFCGGSYTAQLGNLDAEEAINLYCETGEAEAVKGRLAMIVTPGLKVFATLTDTPVRGSYNYFGRAFVVAGGTFYEVYADGTFTNYGAVRNDGLPASFASGGTQLLIASGGVLYVFDLTALTFRVPAGAPPSIVQVGYSDGFFIALTANSDLWQTSNLLDATTWSGLNVARVSVYPDNVVAMIVDHREVWLFGTKTTIPYYDSGNLFPFDTVPGGYIEQGCAATFSPRKLDNTVFWLGANERGQGVVWRAQGYSPVRVSTHAVEQAIGQYSTIADAIGWTYESYGHSFYALYFPTANATWVYDVATGLWHKRGYWNVAHSAYDAHLAQCHVFVFGKHLVGDRQSGKLYQMDASFSDDAGTPLRWLRRAPYISTESTWMYFHELEIEMDMGLEAQPGLIGPAAFPGSITLADPTGAKWTVTIDDNGDIHTAAGSPYPVTVIVLDDNATGATSWQVVITTAGNLDTVSYSNLAGGVRMFPMATSGTALASGLMVSALGFLATIPPLAAQRPPQAMIRWSDDGAKTWSNEYWLSAGLSGAYANRMRKLAMGRTWGTRGRVYELAGSDPGIKGIVDAQLRATPGFQPQERISAQYRKGA